MDYSSLPFLNIYTTGLSTDTTFLLETYGPYASDFLLSEISKMLTGKFTFDGVISLLPNILTSPHAMERLLYLQAFMIFDAKSGYYTQRAGLNSYELRYTLSGEGILEYEGKKYSLKEGEGFFISSKKPHTYYPKNGSWKCTVMHINGVLCEDFFSAFGSDGSYKFSKEHCPAFEMMQYQVISASQRIIPYQEYRINCLLDLLLSELITSGNYNPDKKNSSNDKVITAVLDFIHTHYSEEIIFENVAKDFGISRTLLFSEFKRYTGTAPFKYLMSVRIRQAKLLLTATDYSIEQIATQTGFKDAGHFSQIFKKEAGITPLKYRKSSSHC